MTSRRFAVLLSSLVLMAAPIGCSGTEVGTFDGGPGADAGGRDDAATMDASPSDAATDDAGEVADGGGDEDGGSDGSVDAGAGDAGSDGGIAEDACVVVDCAAPPEGCRWVGSSACECGTLVCDSGTCEPACAADQFCDLCSIVASCMTRPTGSGRICPSIFAPVCGCDGMTYSNSCVLGAAGMGLLHDGECDAPVAVCNGTTCGASEYCDFAVSCSGTGSCAPFDASMLCSDVFDPVCGCDGLTYGNDCEAARSGVDVDHPGECASAPPADECVTDADCSGRETCQTCRTTSGPANVCLPRGTVC